MAVRGGKARVTKEKCQRGLEEGDLGPVHTALLSTIFRLSTVGPAINSKIFSSKSSNFPICDALHFPWIPQYTIRGTENSRSRGRPLSRLDSLRVIDNKLTLHMFQRSGDTPIGVPSNMVQYAALTMMIAHMTKTIPYEYVHTISDAHMYVDQVPAVEMMLERESRPFPTMK